MSEKITSVTGMPSHNLLVILLVLVAGLSRVVVGVDKIFHDPLYDPNLTPSSGALAAYKIGNAGYKITIDDVPAINLLDKLRKEQYECLQLSKNHLDILLEGQLVNQDKVNWAFMFQNKFIECTPFLNDLMARGFEQLGDVGKFAKVWLDGVHKFLKDNRLIGFQKLITMRNVRELGALNVILKATLLDPNRFDARIFGTMTPNEQTDAETMAQRYFARAYHAGDGFCNHINSPPFSHIGNLINNAMLVERRLMQTVRGPSKERLNFFNCLRQNLLKGDDPEPILVLFGLQKVCHSLKHSPSPSMIKHIEKFFGSMELPAPRSLAWHTMTNMDMEIRNSLMTITKTGQKPKACNWIEMYKYKRMFHVNNALAETYNTFMVSKLRAAANVFIDRCLARLLTQAYDKNVKFYPDYPHNLPVEHLVRRLELLPEILGKGIRMLDSIDTRDMQRIGEFDENWFHDFGPWLVKNYKSSEKQIESYANGGDFCKFYTNQELGVETFSMIELMYSMLDLVDFKLNISNDATAFFLMWRVCKLNSLLPIKLDKMTSIDTDDKQQTAVSVGESSSSASHWRDAVLKGKQPMI